MLPLLVVPWVCVRERKKESYTEGLWLEKGRMTDDECRHRETEKTGKETDRPVSRV